MSGQLQRQLTPFHAVVIGLGSMIGAGVFTALGLAAALTGGHPGLLFAAIGLAALTALLNALATAQLATVHPTSGGTYVYGREQLHPWAGFLAGWGFVTGKTASVAAMATTIGLYVFPDDGAAARLTGVVAVVVLTGVALAGISRTAQATMAILVPVLGVLLLTIVGGLFFSELVDSSPAASLPDAPWLGVFMAAGVLFFAFAGYARVATMGEEVQDPRRSIPRAILIALAITVALFVALAWGLLSALGSDGLAESSAPVRAALEASFGSGWGWVALAAAGLASAGAMLNLLTGITRTSLAMGRQGDLPGVFTRVWDRTGAPWVGQVVVAVAVIVLVLATDILTVVGFSSFGVLVYYAIANLSAFTLGSATDRQRRHERATGEDEDIPARPLRLPRWVNLVGAGLCLLLAFTLPGSAVMAMLGVFLVGAGGRAFVLAGRNRPQHRR
ncbi:MAG: APC family permease [Micrococcus sp.]|nr:APC family permease [Micrococcus sp.]